MRRCRPHTRAPRGPRRLRSTDDAINPDNRLRQSLRIAAPAIRHASNRAASRPAELDTHPRLASLRRPPPPPRPSHSHSWTAKHSSAFMMGLARLRLLHRIIILVMSLSHLVNVAGLVIHGRAR